jgi:hypothetical protein
MHEKQTNKQPIKQTQQKEKEKKMQPVNHTCSLLYKGSMHACTPTIDQATTVLCCVHNNHHHHHHHHIMIDHMMIMLHIESNSKLPNKSKVSTFRVCIWSKEEETLLHLGSLPPFFLFLFFFLFFFLLVL